MESKFAFTGYLKIEGQAGYGFFIDIKYSNGTPIDKDGENTEVFVGVIQLMICLGGSWENIDAAVGRKFTFYVGPVATGPHKGKLAAFGLELLPD